MFASPSVCILCACRLRSEAAAVLGMRALNWLMESCHGPFTGLIRHFCGRVRVRVGGRLASCRSTACSRSQNQTTHPLQSCRGGLMKCPTLWVKSQSCCGCFHYLYLAFPITNIFEYNLPHRVTERLFSVNRVKYDLFWSNLHYAPMQISFLLTYFPKYYTAFQLRQENPVDLSPCDLPAVSFRCLQRQ